MAMPKTNLLKAMLKAMLKCGGIVGEYVDNVWDPLGTLLGPCWVPLGSN